MSRLTQTVGRSSWLSIPRSRWRKTDSLSRSFIFDVRRVGLRLAFAPFCGYRNSLSPSLAIFVSVSVTCEPSIAVFQFNNMKRRLFIDFSAWNFFLSQEWSKHQIDATKRYVQSSAFVLSQSVSQSVRARSLWWSFSLFCGAQGVEVENGARNRFVGFCIRLCGNYSHCVV